MRKSFQSFVHLILRMDNWVMRRKVNVPQVPNLEHDLKLLGGGLGFIIRLIGYGFALFFIGWFIFWYFLYFGPRPAISNPEQQLVVATVQPSPTAIISTNPWDNEPWLSSADAQALRGQINVINVAYLEAGGAKYSSTHSVAFASSDPWQQTVPFGMTNLSVTGTVARVSINGYDYILNVYQPIVLSSLPNKIFIIDINGKVWQADYSAVKVVSLEDAIKALPVTVNPNPDLTFTY